MVTPADFLDMLCKYFLLPFVGGLLGAAIRGWFENRRFFKLEKARDVYGRWIGELRYLGPRLPVEKIEIELYPKRFWNFDYWLNSKLINGVIRSNGGSKEDLLVRGGFYQPDQLMLDYRSRQPVRRQFGSLILKLDSSGVTLKGNFIGFFDEPLVGALALEKTVEARRAD